MVPFILMNMISLTICMIILVAVADVRHRMHLLHLPNIQVHKINTNSNSQGVIDPSRYFYFIIIMTVIIQLNTAFILLSNY